MADAKGLKVELSNSTHPFATNPTVLHIQADVAGGGVSNPGWWGMNLREGVVYKLSLFAESALPLTISARLVDQNQIIAEENIYIDGAWREYTASLFSAVSKPSATLEIHCVRTCDVYLDHVSLFPRW